MHGIICWLQQNVKKKKMFNSDPNTVWICFFIK